MDRIYDWVIQNVIIPLVVVLVIGTIVGIISMFVNEETRIKIKSWYNDLKQPA